LKTDRVATEVAKFTDVVEVLMDWSVAVSGASKDFYFAVSVYVVGEEDLLSLLVLLLIDFEGRFCCDVGFCGC
jgi:hypothetical protein